MELLPARKGTPPGRSGRPQPEEGPLRILYEDEALLVLDKPAGLVVHPTYKNTSGTLLNFVLWRYRDRLGGLAEQDGLGGSTQQDPPYAIQPGILTRLDKDTSGVVVVTLTPGLHATMQRDMTAGRVRKEYLAVVSGAPEPASGRIVLPLGRDPADRRRVIVRDDGQHAETIYETIERSGGHAVVRCELVTGRTHQIRVHLAARGCPIVGDRTYAPLTDAIARQALHAWRVVFPHPLTRDTVTIEAPVPEDIDRCIGRIA